MQTVRLDRDHSVVTLTKEGRGLLESRRLDDDSRHRQELRWYFEQVRSHPTPSRSNALDQGFYEAREAFCAPPFKALYRAWKQDGEPVLTSAGSRAIRDAVEAGVGHVRPLNSVTGTAISPSGRRRLTINEQRRGPVRYTANCLDGMRHDVSVTRCL